MLLEPVLVGLDGERPHQPQATFAIGEDAHDLGAAPDLLVQPFQHIGRFEVLMVLPRQPVKCQRLVEKGKENATDRKKVGQPLFSGSDGNSRGAADCSAYGGLKTV